MIPRDEAWERRAAADHVFQLRTLLRKGQNIDIEIEGVKGTLREFLTALSDEIRKVLK